MPARPYFFRAIRALFCLTLFVLAAESATGAPQIEVFSPVGTHKSVQQVSARFATPMVVLGSRTALIPFVIDCAAAGSGRWLDEQAWVFDFERPLPAGVACTFTRANKLHDLAGRPVGGRKVFRFDTGGPSVIATEPWDGSTIDESQIFLLGLDAAVDIDSLLANTQCRIDGVAEAVGVEVVTGEVRDELLAANASFVQRYADVVLGDAARARSASDEASVRARLVDLSAESAGTIVLLKCRRELPNGAKFWLDWGTGIAAANGIATTQAQTFEFQVRDSFTANFRCERVNANAPCIPAFDMRVEFTAPVSTAEALTAELRDAQGRSYPARDEGGSDAEITSAIIFKGPFPERAKLTLTLPTLRDDAARELVNRARYPLQVATGDDPPLAKFAADFGVIERHHATLPLTVRNLDANLRHLPVPPAVSAKPSIVGFLSELAGRDPAAGLLENPVVATVRGRYLKLDARAVPEVGRWLHAMRTAQRDDYQYDEKSERYVLKTRAGETSLLNGNATAREFEIPRQSHAKAFEVIGIPLPEPGLYVVEVASPRLGAALFGKPGTYFAQSIALVTDLAVHLKWGRESSLVWVTSLARGAPIKNARVNVQDCKGTTLWQGGTNGDGVAAIARELPRSSDLPSCEWSSQGLIVTAQVGNDIGLVSSAWNEGIENWRFNLPSASPQAPVLVHTIFDRPLYRTAETVHMKHILRQHQANGFAPLTRAPTEFRARHLGSDEIFPLQVAADAGSATSRWNIPRTAKLGRYTIEYQLNDGWFESGVVDVESFRVPLMRASLQVPRPPTIAAKSLTFDAQINFLAGGAARDLPVTFRAIVEPRSVTYPAFPEFTFMNGDAPLGISSEAEETWRWRPPDAAARSELIRTERGALDQTGGAQFALTALPSRLTPQWVQADMEFQDPNGEIQTKTTRVPWWPAGYQLGIKPQGWTLAQEAVNFQVVALDTAGEPAPNVQVTVTLRQRLTHSHRKRLHGGFYAYDNSTEVKELGPACQGRTDRYGMLNCRIKAPVSGNLILRATAADPAGNISYAHRDVWVAGRDEWWFGAYNDDRMDVLPERQDYAPDDTARLQVRMPFRRAQALVTVEREGVLDYFVTELSGRAPVLELPLKGHYAPNVFVSVLALRGRLSDIAPTALLDLGKPAYKLGIAELRVGWNRHALNVAVVAPKTPQRPRTEVTAEIQVSHPDGVELAAGAEVAIAVVDEGLLELRSNESWDLLRAMMGRRGAEVQTATAQLQVVGKRHYGRKARLPGGGGGQGAATRELFDTLLTWEPHLKLDAAGHASFKFKLNDSLTSFRVVAVATDGHAFFGHGDTSLTVTQDVQLFAGLPRVVREGDRLQASFTVRNSAPEPLTLEVRPGLEVAPTNAAMPLVAKQLTLAGGSAQEVVWEIEVPPQAQQLTWQLSAATQDEKSRDSLRVTQAVEPAVPTRTIQAGVVQLTEPRQWQVARPADAVVAHWQVALAPTLASDRSGITQFFHDYRYQCLEQRLSRAVGLNDQAAWQQLMTGLNGYQDAQGLLRYFPNDGPGSDILSAYLPLLASAAEWEIPTSVQQALRRGLVDFIEGRLTRDSPLRAADFAVRRLSAMAALATQPEGIAPDWVGSINPTLTRWPNSALLDWLTLLQFSPQLPERAAMLALAHAELRGRLVTQATLTTLRERPDDQLWWLMGSSDLDLIKVLHYAVKHGLWTEDLPRLVNGVLARQRQGHWDTTVANAWGAATLRAVTRVLEATPPAGATELAFAGVTQTKRWDTPLQSTEYTFDWPTGNATLQATHQGIGAPWFLWQARAAIPLTAPTAAGFRLTRTVAPLAGHGAAWRVGDVYRVELTIEAPSAMTWVVIDDPLPTGGIALSDSFAERVSLDADSAFTRAPTFAERTATAYRAYFDYLPQGVSKLVYFVRLQTAGKFRLPPSRVEAMYAPAMFGEVPLAPVTVLP